MQRAVHIAGVIDRAEADLLIACGVRRIGLPFVLGYHPEDLSRTAAAAIVRALGHQARFFLITYLESASSVVGLCRELGVDMVQLHGAIPPEELIALRTAWPDLYIIKSLIVGGNDAEALEREVDLHSPTVDAFITDTLDPVTGATGATGKTHDWRISAAIVQRSVRPVILAGGLNADNVRDAIDEVKPAAVDAHTGVEGPDGRKDRRLVERFVAEARLGFANLEASRDE